MKRRRKGRRRRIATAPAPLEAAGGAARGLEIAPSAPRPLETLNFVDARVKPHHLERIAVSDDKAVVYGSSDVPAAVGWQRE